MQMKEYILNTPDQERRLMIERLADYFRNNNIAVHAALDIPELPLPKLFPNPGFGDQRRKQPHLLGVHNDSGELYIGLVKTRNEDLMDENSLTEYDLYMNLTVDQPGIRFCLMMHEDRIHQFNSFITHYLHPDFWPHFIAVAYSNDE
jgi:hypothetical protein